MGRAGSPIYKGEPGDYDLSFVRSFQLFCPIKISIFSPIAAILANSPFAVSLSLPPLPFPPARSFLPCHPPYGSIDRAQPCDSSSSHPHPSCYTTTVFSPSSLSSLFFLFAFSLSRSFLPPFFPSLSHSLHFLPLSPPTPFRLQYSIIGYVNVRGSFAKSGKRSRLRFLRAYQRARVSLPFCGCHLTMQPRKEKQRNKEREKEKG